MIPIPFVKIYLTGKEHDYITQAATLAGDGSFTRACHALIEKQTGCHKALLTHSCTAALEMAALLLDIQPGDEIIMPSYTFVSTANAFVLRGAKPVFVDIRKDTLNLNEQLIEAAITPKTKAIVPVHYAGIACEMDTILKIADKYHLYVVEDAAQGVMAKYKGRMLGTLGHLGTFSYHETKNVISGEGGSLIINDPQFDELAEIIREKGTDRSRFYRGEIDKYTWQHVGSSYLPSELIAAFLLAQLEQADTITRKRRAIWDAYHAAFEHLELAGFIRRPIVPVECEHNAHMYYILVPNVTIRARLLSHLKQNGILSVFHYVPLHLSPGGKQYARVHESLPLTETLSARLIRMPLYFDMTQAVIERIVEEVENVFCAVTV